jgi:hypothetical protein
MAGRTSAWLWRAAAALLLLLAPIPPAAAQTAEQVRAALAEVLRDGDLQQELPSRAASLPERTGAEAPAPAPSSPEARMTLPSNLKWLLLGLLLLGAAVFLVRALRDRRPVARAAPAPAPAAPAAAPEPAAVAAEGPREEADRLAAEGRLAEAVHRLLLDALELLRRRGEALAPALTAREILRRVRLPAAEGEALGQLVALVERCWFGGQPTSLDDYRRCRESVDRLRGVAA